MLYKEFKWHMSEKAEKFKTFCYNVLLYTYIAHVTIIKIFLNLNLNLVSSCHNGVWNLRTCKSTWSISYTGSWTCVLKLIGRHLIKNSMAKLHITPLVYLMVCLCTWGAMLNYGVLYWFSDFHLSNSRSI